MWTVRPQGQCLTDELVVRLASGEVVPDDVIQAHLASCESCCTAVAVSARVAGQRDNHTPTTALNMSRASHRGTTFRELERGARLGRYEIGRVRGRGGMGIVYEAHDPQLHRNVALKVMRPDIDDVDSRGERLLREARAMAQLSHPNVVHVYDVGTLNGQVYVAMELVEGSTLRAWFRASEHRPWRDVVALLLGAGDGLSAAHAAGLVHRDFKPENVLIGTDGRARVTDFGLARALDRSTPSTPMGASLREEVLQTITQAGATPGTPEYMSPEQLLGHGLDARSDQFSYCVALYEALYWKRPFTDRSAEERLEGMKLGAPRPARTNGVPLAVHEIMVRGLAFEPAERHVKMAVLLDALRAQLARPPRSRRLVWAVAATVVAGGAAFAIASFTGTSAAPSAAAPTRAVPVTDRDSAAAPSPGVPMEQTAIHPEEAPSAAPIEPDVTQANTTRPVTSRKKSVKRPTTTTRTTTPQPKHLGDGLEAPHL